MNLVIVKYNSGNIFSVCSAVSRLGYAYVVSDDPNVISTADKVIFPGVGEAGSTMKYLCEHGLDGTIKNLKQPVLGICLGMQLLCTHSEERETQCLGIIDAKVKRFTATAECRVPQMGWNRLEGVDGWIPRALESSHVYFVNSYYVPVGSYTVARADHGVEFSAAVRFKNFFGVQFHPEKSGDPGERVLKTFLTL